MVYSNTVVDIFDSWVKAKPENLAVKFGAIELTYKQLDERSNQLANFLVTQGIKPGTLVPICFQSPLNMVISIWGVLKAGAAYVPIDSDFPIDRIKYMVGDTAAELVISDNDTTQFLTAAEGKTIILADNNWAILNESPTAPTGIQIPVDSVAYVIYTSGSTGLPKGVLLEHKSLSHYISGLTTRMPYPGCKSFSIGVSFAADMIITQLFGAFTLGAALHLFEKTITTMLNIYIIISIPLVLIV